jgi:hypothetical protein
MSYGFRTESMVGPKHFHVAGPEISITNKQFENSVRPGSHGVRSQDCMRSYSNAHSFDVPKSSKRSNKSSVG